MSEPVESSPRRQDGAHVVTMKFSVLDLPGRYARAKTNLVETLLVLDPLYREAMNACGRGELNDDEVAALETIREIRSALVRALPGGDDPEPEPGD